MTVDSVPIAAAAAAQTAGPVRYVYDDGGRLAAGFRGIGGDCVVRAMAIALKLPYKLAHESLAEEMRRARVAYRRVRLGQHLPPDP